MSTATPYPEPDGSGSTSGWSGSETSHERALSEDSSGRTRLRQAQVIDLLGKGRNLVGDQWGSAGVRFIGLTAGLTVTELRHLTGWHHGKASSALSVLHKEGKIARLKDRRDRCAVYVLPEYVNGRETATPGRTKANALTAAERQTIRDARASINNGWAVSRSTARDVLAIVDRLTGGQ